MRTIGFSILPWCAACAHWEWAVCATSAATPIASVSQHGVGFFVENALARLAGCIRAIDRSTTRAGRIAGEVAVFDSQGPAVVDRSAVRAGRIADEVAVFDSQGPAVDVTAADRSAIPGGRIAGEAAVFDSQGPEAVDRSSTSAGRIVGEAAVFYSQWLYAPYR